MKITFKNNIKNRDNVLFVRLSDEKEQVVLEDGVRVLYLKPGENVSLRKLFLLIRKMVFLSKTNNAKKVIFDFSVFKFKNLKISDVELAEIIGSQLSLANYEFVKYRTNNSNNFIEEFVILNTKQDIQKAILKGHLVAGEVNMCRDLSNTPGADMTPKILAEKAKLAVKGLPVKVNILGEKEMEKLSMNGLLSVGRGSEEESKFIIMEYFGSSKKEKPIVLVGKGVTFDSGGINLKPSSSLSGMNMDMSGGASVIYTISSVAKLKLKKNVIALIPAVENMASGKSYRPGDIVRSMSKKTIEVLNTDAEGRIILADALTYSKKYNPEIVIDVATLTGAACVALGEKASAIFTKNDLLAGKIEKSAEISGEYVWRLPLWEEYENEIKGTFADLTNIHNKDSRYGGAIYAAIFLFQFIKDSNWIHIDMAPRMVSTAGEYLSPGSTGEPVKLLFKFIENYK